MMIARVGSVVEERDRAIVVQLVLKAHLQVRVALRQ